MILLAKEEQKAEIRELWETCFPKEDPAYIDHYFKNIWTPRSCYVDMEDGRVVSSICRNPHDILFNEKVLRISMLTGMATLPEYRNQGRMHAMMDLVVDACSHSELMTCICTDRPEMYEPFGFRTGFERTAYMIQRPDLKRIPPLGTAYEVKPLDMLKVYSAYIRRFNGFYTRDLEYFINYKRQILSQGGKFIAYFNAQDRICGYAAYILNGSDLYIDELVYLDSVALSKILNGCLQERPRVHFHVSVAEDLRVVFPRAQIRPYIGTMVRINDYELFGKLFKTRCHTVDEALSISYKPLNQNEVY